MGEREEAKFSSSNAQQFTWFFWLTIIKFFWFATSIFFPTVRLASSPKQPLSWHPIAGSLSKKGLILSSQKAADSPGAPVATSRL